MAVDWIKFVASKRKIKIILKSPYKEGDWFGAGEEGQVNTKNLVDLEKGFYYKK